MPPSSFSIPPDLLIWHSDDAFIEMMDPVEGDEQDEGVEFVTVRLNLPAEQSSGAFLRLIAAWK